MASEIGVPISVTAKMPDHFLDKVILDSEDSNAIMAAITDVAKDIRLLARRKWEADRLELTLQDVLDA